MKVLTVFALAALVGFAAASCPNQCSGHGRCGQTDKCSCFYRWEGADCSLRKCQEEIAWVDGTTWDPHTYAECANKGICNQETGECECFVGYEGVGCRRSVCPNACSGHGTCEFINDLSTYASTAWDYGKVQGCKCDPWYQGDDCSLRMCPRGDDPLTIPASTNGDTWTTTITYNGTIVAGDISFLVKDLYNATFTTRPYSFALSDAAGSTRYKTILEELRPIDSVVSASVATLNNVGSYPFGNNNNTKTFTVVLSNPARITDLWVEYRPCEDAGCQPLRANFDGGSIAGWTSSMTTAGDALLETDVCSNRGICDMTTGRCQCFEGHFGLACQTQTILV